MCIYAHSMVTSLLILSICIALIDGFSSVAAPPIVSSKSVQVDTDKIPTNYIREGFWKWRGHDIFTQIHFADKSVPSSKKKPTCILLHGFGASTTYWRETMSTLQNEGYDVHAIDLLGQGRSSKPYFLEEKEDSVYRLYPTEDKSSNTIHDTESIIEMGKNSDTKVEYSINLWAKLVDDYARENQLDDVVLMGNSLGSLVAISAATGDFIESNTIDRNNLFSYLAGNNVGDRSRVRGLCLFNCAVGLNSQNILKNNAFNPIQRAVFSWLFDVLNTLIFDNEWLLKFALNNIVTKELLEDALKSLYTYSPSSVDEELVDSFYYPAKFGGDGAVEAIRQIYTNDAGLRPMDYHEKYPEILDNLPIHLIWGLEDVVTPITGDVGMFYCDRVANNRSGKGKTAIDVVKSGHIPFDDNPVDTHNAMMKWLENKIVK